MTVNTQSTLFGTNKGHIQNILAMCYHKDIKYNLNVVGVASSSIDPASYIEKNASSDVLKQHYSLIAAVVISMACSTA